jgi:hypothetical protein
MAPLTHSIRVFVTRIRIAVLTVETHESVFLSPALEDASDIKSRYVRK